MGSNTTIKQWVAEGRLCYLCEKQPPTHIESQFAWMRICQGMCLACYLDIENRITLYEMRDLAKDGYVRREEYQPDAL